MRQPEPDQNPARELFFAGGIFLLHLCNGGVVSRRQPTPTTMTTTELRNEISNCNEAIKAFKIGCPHLAPDGLSEAPSVKWLEMQKRLCVRKLTAIRNAIA